MLDKAVTDHEIPAVESDSGPRHLPHSAGFDVEIAGVATAVPEHEFSQADALDRAAFFIPRYACLSNVFNSTGIKRRFSCVPMEWYRTSRGWRESNEVYLEHAVDLLEKVAADALADAGASADDVDAVVTVSSTGLAIPSLDALLANRMGLPDRMERTPIFGLGCAGGTTGLARASRIAHTIPGGTVLLLVVELAGINVHINSENPSLFVSAALFGDGAAAVVLRNTAELPADPSRSNGADAPGARPRVVATGEHMWPDTGYIMGWKVEDNGLDVVLSTSLPEFTRDNLRPAAEAFLARNGITLSDIDGYIFHPGGPKVLAAVSETLEIDPADLDRSREVLENFGNMSAPTVLFVLERTLRSGARGRHLMAAFGPAFTVTFAVLDL